MLQLIVCKQTPLSDNMQIEAVAKREASLRNAAHTNTKFLVKALNKQVACASSLQQNEIGISLSPQPIKAHLISTNQLGQLPNESGYQVTPPTKTKQPI